MRSSPFHAMAIGIVLALSAGMAMAAEPTTQTQSVGEILQVQHDLRAKLDHPNGEYSRFSQDAISRMQRAQDKVFSMLNGVESLDELNLDQKTDLSNALDEVKAILLANEQNRMICHRERKTGTNLLQRHCETVAQREANVRDVNRAMFHDGIAR